MLYAFKIIICIVVGVIGFKVFLNLDSLKELKKKATPEEKKDMEYVEWVAFLSPFVIIALFLCITE